ncbi:Spy/CpxP family protein refolding chaperone [Psychrobacter sp. 1U2]|uniref:Spy/CpxP family protein refolding chaperone n=1 Tax=Psychrobacter sp. 1U2 TaxID=3453577 RepID=UPI003F45F411
MKNLTIATLLSASTLLGMAGIASAAPDNQPQRASQMQHHKGGMSANKGPLSQLNLTATQQAQIEAIKEAKKTERDNNRAQNQAQREQMREQVQALSNANTLDTVTLNRLADQHAQQAKQRFIDRVQSQQAIAKVLTADQRAQLQQMRAERGEQGENRGRGDRGHSRSGA